MSKFIKAARHVLRSRMVKRAYGVYDNFEYIERAPFINTSDFEDSATYAEQLKQGPKAERRVIPLPWPELTKRFKNHIKALKSYQKTPFYDDPIYKGVYPDEIALSKYRYHYDDNDKLNEVSLSDYIHRIEKALKEKDYASLEDAADYGSIRATIKNPDVIRRLQEAITKKQQEEEPLRQANEAWWDAYEQAAEDNGFTFQDRFNFDSPGYTKFRQWDADYREKNPEPKYE